VLEGALQIAGPHLQLHPLSSKGWDSIGIALRPGGARILLGRPISVVANLMVDATELWGRWANEVLERVASQSSTRARVELFLQLLQARAEGAPDRFMEAILERARQPGADLRPKTLAMAAGYSERQLRRKFAEDLGIGPKELSRILRLHAALGNPGWRQRGWAEHAVQCGYYDQSHLIGEFRLLLGQSPEKFLQTIVEPRLLAAHLAITRGKPAHDR
jgi:AraC-like DNA-binding protein